MNRSEVDAVARLLDGEPVEDGHASEEARALASLGAALQASAVRPRAEFTADLRAMLVEEARTQAANPGLFGRLRTRMNDATARWRYSTRVAAASGAAAVALSGGGVAVAAQQAVPGDVLYPVKVAMADARLAFTRDAADRAERQLTIASDRAEEAGQAVAAGNQDAGALALRDADERTRDGAQTLLGIYQQEGRISTLIGLGEFTAAQRARIQAMAPSLTGTAVVAASDALVVLDRVDARVAALLEGCTACPAGGEGFDYSYIPPATEAFEPCPCAPAATDEPNGEAPTGSGTAAEPRADDEPPADADGPTTASEGAPGDTTDAAPQVEVRGPAGSIVEEPTRTLEDATQRVVDDILKKAVEDPQGKVEDTVEDLGEAGEGLLP